MLAFLYFLSGNPARHAVFPSLVMDLFGHSGERAFWPFPAKRRGPDSRRVFGEREGRGEKPGKAGTQRRKLGRLPLGPLPRGGARRAGCKDETGLLSLSVVGRLNLGIQSPRPGARSARAWVLHALRPGLKKRVGAGSRQGADGRRNGEKSGRGWPVGRLAGWSDARPARLPFAVLTRQNPPAFSQAISLKI